VPADTEAQVAGAKIRRATRISSGDDSSLDLIDKNTTETSLVYASTEFGTSLRNLTLV
jgi:hypothetical protein